MKKNKNQISKFLCCLGIIVLMGGALAGQAGAAINIPANPVISPVDTNTSQAGFQGYLYVPDYPMNQIKIVEIQKLLQGAADAEKVTAVLGPPRSLAVSPDGQLIYVASDTFIKCYDKNGGWKWTKQPPFGALQQITVSLDGKLLFAVDAGAWKVHVLRPSTGDIIKSIDIPVDGAFGIALSPSKTMLAVTIRSANGALYVWDLQYKYAADKSIADVTAVLRGAPVSNLYMPTYVVFSSDNSRIFVRVHDNTALVDAKVIKASNLSDVNNIQLGAGKNEYDPNNQYGEALAISPNGKYLYLTHYRNDPSLPAGEINKVHAYRRVTINTDGTIRTDWNTPVSLDGEIKNNLFPSKDGIAVEPDGSRVWFTSSDGGNYAFSTYTGFTVDTGNGYGELKNAVPGTTAVIHPESSVDDLNNIPFIKADGTDFQVEWKSTAPDPAKETMYYNLQYATFKNMEANLWDDFSGAEDTTLTKIKLSAEVELIPGETYTLRVRANDHYNTGPWAYSEPFRVVKPIITATEIQSGTNQPWTPSKGAPITYTVKILGQGFGEPLNGEGDTTYYNVKFDNQMIADVFPNAGYEVQFWGQDQGTPTIKLGIPRVDKDGKFIEAGDKNLKVTAFGVESDPYSFTISPIINSLNPDKGGPGDEIEIQGYGFGAAQGTDDKVYFTDAGGQPVEAIVQTNGWTRGADYDSIKVIVPKTAVTGSVWVVVDGKFTSNKKDFTVESLAAPTIKGIQVKHGSAGTYNVQDWAYICDTVKITGTGFGNDPGKGNADSVTNNVTFAGFIVRDDRNENSSGQQIYSWKDTEIEFGIPRRIEKDFMEAGPNAIAVTAIGQASASVNLNIKPYLYSLSPAEGPAGTTIVKVNGTALAGKCAVLFGSAGVEGSRFVRNFGDNPDGSTNGDNDVVNAGVPAGLSAGTYKVTANVNNQTSNNDLDFKVTPAGAPIIFNIIPNAAPNTADYKNVLIKGMNFNKLAVVSFKNGATTVIATNIIVNDTDPKNTTLTMDVPIKTQSMAIGKWDVELKNPDNLTATWVKGFTVLDGSNPNNETSQIIDDFEGVVVDPKNYKTFINGGPITYAPTISDKFEGDKSMGVTSFDLTNVNYAGYDGFLTKKADISSYKTIILWVKSADASGSLIKIQLTDNSGNNFAAVDAAGKQVKDVPTANSTFTKHSIDLDKFVQVDPSTGIPSGGAKLDATLIKDYQLVMTGDKKLTAPVYVDFIAAGGYTPPTPGGPITTTIKRDGNIANTSTVTLSWTSSDPLKPVTSVDIYASPKYSTTVNDWGTAIATGISASTYTPPNTKVGDGKNMFYKLVPAGQGLSPAILQVDVVGKFDLVITAQAGIDTLYVASVPFEIESGKNLISSVIGTQLTGADNELSADRIWVWNESKQDWEFAWLVNTNGAFPQYDGHWFTGNTDTTLTVNSDTGFFVQIRSGNSSKNITLTGNISTKDRTIAVNSGKTGAFLGFVGTTFPVNVSLVSSKLGTYATGADNELTADRVWSWDDTKQDWEFAWLVNTGGAYPQYDGHWFTGNSDTLIQLVPGRGYFVQLRDTHNGFNWIYPKPY